MLEFDQVIKLHQEAVDATPQDHLDRAPRLENLGGGYRDRYQRTGTIADLERAVKLYQEAVDTTPQDHPDRAPRLQDLGAGYLDRYQRTGTIADLERAIELLREAVDTTPQDHPDRARRLQNLGAGYGDRYQRTGTIADLERAVKLHQEAVDTTPQDHPDRAPRLQDLGAGYLDRYQRTGMMADLERAVQWLQDALSHSSSPVQNRIVPGKSLIYWHSKLNNWTEAYEAGFKAVSLVPQLTPRSLENSDKQHLLTDIYGLASEVAAVALNASKTPFDAIQVLELGRGVITGSLNEMRADVSDLQRSNPQLAEKYIGIRDQLDAPTLSAQYQANQRYNVGKELEKIIQEIRLLPSFDGFLRAPSEGELKAAAAAGPIVIINISEYRCDALIIETSQLRLLPLPNLHDGDIRGHARNDLADVGILEWLWETTAKPILDALGFTQTPSDDCWPHIWWILTGPLTRFPIHAAGRHSHTSVDTVLDRAISSYSSSVKAIIYGRRHRSQHKERLDSGHAVLVSMSKTPQQEPLQWASKEIDQVEKLCKTMQLQVTRPPSFQKHVLSELKRCSVFHFAGHGSTESDDPSKSALLLKDWKTEPLTVASLFDTNIQRQMPFLAYLSACGTGRNKRDELMDEGLHLISACQLAGFQHVVGTLWDVNDKFCVDMATEIYKWIRDHGMTDKSVSQALHEASRSLRNQWIKENAARGELRWKSYKWIKENVARGALKWKSYNDQGVHSATDGRTPMRRSCAYQGDRRNPRDGELCDETKLTQLHWVPYVHFGV